MLDRKYLRNYTDVMCYCIKNYSQNTTLLLANIIENDDTLLKIEKIINTKPAEDEFLERIDCFKREWLKKFEAKSPTMTTPHRARRRAAVGASEFSK